MTNKLRCHKFYFVKSNLALFKTRVLVQLTRVQGNELRPPQQGIHGSSFPVWYLASIPGKWPLARRKVTGYYPFEYLQSESNKKNKFNVSCQFVCIVTSRITSGTFFAYLPMSADALHSCFQKQPLTRPDVSSVPPAPCWWLSGV